MEKKAQTSQILNHITAARGTKYHELDGDHHIIGYKNVQFWIPSLQSWIPARDPDKFLVESTDFNEAWQTFWLKWKKYISTRFPGLTYVSIENIN